MEHVKDWPLWEALVRRSIRGSVRRDLAGVYVAGPLPSGGAVLAPNHATWWDGYVLRDLAWSLNQPCRIVMNEPQLARFPFLRRVGALGTRDLRSAVRATRAGAWVVVFPEGELQPPGAFGPLRPGADWLARQAGVPLVPVGVRVLVRGAQKPEAFLRFTSPTADLARDLPAVVRRLDADVRAAFPDVPPSGYLRWVRGVASKHDRVDLPSRLLAYLTGDA